MSEPILALTIPKWGLTMTEGTLTKWHVAVGDSVSEGTVLADIETSKIVNELEARASGTIRRLIIAEGATLPVGMLIGVMAAPSIDDSAIDAFIAAFDGEDAEPAAPTPSVSESPAVVSSTAAQTQPAPSPQIALTGIPAQFKAGPGTDNAQILATPQAHKLASKLGLDMAKFTGTGRRGRISRADLAATLGLDLSNPDSKPVSLRPHPPATPLALRLAEQLGLDLAELSLSEGQHRLRSADIVAAAKAPRPAVSAASANAAAIPVQLVAASGDTFEDVPISGMRAMIASRLSASKANAPHYRVGMRVEVDALNAIRAQINDDRRQPKISLNDLIIKAAAAALQACPDVNIQFDGTVVRRFADAHVSVAVALDDGLITPVIRNANRKGVRAISQEMTELAARGREGKLSRPDYEGGSFSISNLGMFGVSHFDAIINPPQAAILAIGGIRRELVSDGAGEGSRTVSIMEVTLSADHRVIDGATSARFLQQFKQLVERPLSMLA